MKYIVDCRKKLESGDIDILTFAGLGDGIPNKSTADKIFNREVSSNKWNAVYLDRVSDGATIISWYKQSSYKE